MLIDDLRAAVKAIPYNAPHPAKLHAEECVRAALDAKLWLAPDELRQLANEKGMSVSDAKVALLYAARHGKPASGPQASGGETLRGTPRPGGLRPESLAARSDPGPEVTGEDG